MVKKQYELYHEILKRLSMEGVLSHLILIGSWCLPVYQDFYFNKKTLTAIRTRDLDFLVPEPAKIKIKTNIPELLKDLGFVKDFIGPKGYIRLVHPELFVEFLVEEKGRASSKPVSLPQLGLNAQPLRFLNFLTYQTVTLDVNGIKVRVPHPADYALHKLIISTRRTKNEKRTKDLDSAFSVLRALIEKGESKAIARALNNAPKKWQKKILQVLQDEQEDSIYQLLKT